MFNGPGKYDDLCTAAREAARAQGAILLIFGGDKGHGFQVQASIDVVLKLPELLRTLAQQIEAQHREAGFFTCPRCARVSHHPKDREHGYCGACHDFTGPAANT
jgi:hypothetical protein